MVENFTKIIMSNKVFAWLALATCVLLLIPLFSMRLTDSVNWGVFDFVFMGGLLFCAGSAVVLLVRNLPRKYWAASCVLVALAALYVWAELAVGIFFNLGS